MDLGKLTTGASAFLRRSAPGLDPAAMPWGSAGTEPPVTSETGAGAPAGLGAPSPIVANTVLEALQSLEAETRPTATITNLATELSSDPDQISPVVAQLENDGFIERNLDQTLGLSEVGKRAVRYTRMSKLP